MLIQLECDLGVFQRSFENRRFETTDLFKIQYLGNYYLNHVVLGFFCYKFLLFESTLNVISFVFWTAQVNNISRSLLEW